METRGLFPDNRDSLLPDMEGWTLGVHSRCGRCKKWMQKDEPGPPSSRDESKQSGPFITPPPHHHHHHSRHLPLRPSLLLSCTRTVVSHPRAQPMVRELGPTSQLNGGSGTELAPPPKGRRPLATHEAGLFAVFAARRAPPSSADSLPPWPSPVEPSRTQPSPAELLDAPAAAARVPPSERASGPGRGGGAAPGGGGARSPQTARGRGRPGRAPAGAAGGGCAAQGEGPGSGRRPCPPPTAPRPQAFEPQSALSIPLPRTLPRARTGLNSGKGGCSPTGRGSRYRDRERR